MALLSAAAAVLALTIGSAPSAEAAETACALQSVDTVTTAQTGNTGLNATIRTDITFSEKADCELRSGDSFSVGLPSELIGYTATFDVLDPDGDVVGSARVTGEEIVLTYGDYVENHLNVRGELFAQALFDQEQVEVGVPVQLSYTVGDRTVPGAEVTPGNTPSERPDPTRSHKHCSFTDPTVRDEISCRILLPDGELSNVRVVDTLGAGLDYVEGSAALNESKRLNDRGRPGSWREVPDGLAVQAESSQGFNVTVATAKGPYSSIAYRVAVVDQTLSEYTNSAEVSMQGRRAETRSSTVRVASSGGVGIGDLPGSGNNPRPELDIEKWSTVEGSVDGDFDDAPGKSLDPGEDESITLTVTNTGDERLVNVTVGDATTAGTGTVRDLVCTFPDDSTGTTWDGPFLVDDSFECVSTLPALGGSANHTDVATVTAVGRTSGQAVDDEDAWNGTTPGAVTPTVDIEKWSTVDGPVAGDHDAAPGKSLDGDDAEGLTFTVSNTGSEALVDVAVSDTTTAGTGTVEDLGCEFPDGTRGTTWKGPFAPEASFECTGTLTAFGSAASHTDVATVTAVGQTSTTSVDDEDAWHATSPDEVEVLPAATTRPDAAAGEQAPGSRLLARTGAEPWAIGLTGAALLALGGGLVLMTSRRRGAHEG